MMHFWEKIMTFFFLCEILQLDKLEEANFKYDNISLK